LVIKILLGGELFWFGTGTGNDTEGTRGGQYAFGLELTCWLLPWRCLGGSSSSDSVRSMTTDGRFLAFGVAVLVDWLRPVLLADADSVGTGENGLSATGSSLTFDLRGTIASSLSESVSGESWDLFRLPFVDLGSSGFQVPSGSIETCVILNFSVAVRISCTYLQCEPRHLRSDCLLVNGNVFKGGRFVADRTRPERRLFLHLKVRFRVEALHVGTLVSATRHFDA
jgi:hypothetical protein